MKHLVNNTEQKPTKYMKMLDYKQKKNILKLIHKIIKISTIYKQKIIEQLNIHESMLNLEREKDREDPDVDRRPTEHETERE